MHATTFACPHCSAKLRVRERRFVGTEIPCPECHRPIRLVADGPTGVKIEAASPAAANPATIRSRVEKPSSSRSHPQNPSTAAGVAELAAKPGVAGSTLPFETPVGSPSWSERLRSPAGLAWIVSTTLAAVLLLMVVRPFSSGAREELRDAESPQAEARNNDAAAKNDAPGEPPRKGAVPPAAGVPTGESRLAALGLRLNGYVETHGHFPRGTVYADGNRHEDRFSWLAELAAEDVADSAVPLWDQPWRSPLNDRFVRRGLPEFQNPGIKSLRSPDGYPATHFVGVAGVGSDAPLLPVDHPRAGVFGIERRTRLEDIKDGMANTMMVAGVREQSGAWAAGGNATIRPLTREPYVNGPDGFGTGQNDGMHVLMADGSVRFVAAATDPRIVRRMAAMADGLPLDASVPGEPGETPRASSEPAGSRAVANDAQDRIADLPPAVAEGPAEPAAPIPRAPEPLPPIDIAAQLAQPLLRFDQTQPALVRDLLEHVEELAGVPIEFEATSLGRAAAGLEKSITISLRNPTVGELLAKILAEAGLAFVPEARAIRIVPANAPDSSSP